jgi:predicted transposase YdaD
MGLFDALLKQLVDDFAPDFAAWLLDSEVESIEPLTLDLPAETLATDTLFRVWLPDGRSILLHIEFQGRRSHRPMPERMLDYMVRIVHEHSLPIRSAVFYIERGAGRHDTGQHQYQGPAGETIVAGTIGSFTSGK